MTTAYEIHHGVITRARRRRRCSPRTRAAAPGAVSGTVWHGALESDGVRRALLAEVAQAAGRDWTPGDAGFEDVRQARLDALGDLVADHLDTGAVVAAARARRARRPAVRPSGRALHDESPAPGCWGFVVDGAGARRERPP